MDNIIRKIQELYPVSDDSLHLLKYCFKQQTFPAKTIIIQAGRFDNQVYFIEKGITRSYILHNGKEITTWFSMEGDATCGSWDLYRHKAGFEYVENFLLLQDIHISRLNLSAQERYEKLIKEYPSIFHRVTLGHIASFLGITQPSLSRIRSSR